MSKASSRMMVVGVMCAAAAIALSVFAVLAWQAVSIQPATESEALRRFQSVRASLPTADPLVQRDPAGRPTRRATTERGRIAPTRLRVLAYRLAEERLAAADVPLWFLKVKGPAVQLALRDTRFDLDALGVTAADLERAGIGVVLDETLDNGDRLLVWTE